MSSNQASASVADCDSASKRRFNSWFAAAKPGIETLLAVVDAKLISSGAGRVVVPYLFRPVPASGQIRMSPPAESTSATAAAKSMDLSNCRGCTTKCDSLRRPLCCLTETALYLIDAFDKRQNPVLTMSPRRACSTHGACANLTERHPFSAKQANLARSTLSESSDLSQSIAKFRNRRKQSLSSFLDRNFLSADIRRNAVIKAPLARQPVPALFHARAMAMP
jgi:hypothetical protein